PGRIMTVPSSYAGSHEAMLHEAVGEPSLMVFTDERDGPWLSAVREHRAIGVVYRPAAERRGNWVPTLMGRRYDALLFFDDTRALRALQPEPLDWPTEAETYPWSV
ncbi:MAG TPA: erythromycin esterase family protein, partial [Jatrophihabitans sp.]|nr:erythromycin esterase family protein [Jatrophihabitans sp.]